MTIENIQQYLPPNTKAEISGNLAIFPVPVLSIQEVVADLCANKKLPLMLITATDERESSGCFKVWYVFGVPRQNIYIAPFIELKGTIQFPSVAGIIHEAINHERKIKTFFGLTPKGNPDTRPIILHDQWPKNAFPLRKDFPWQENPAKTFAAAVSGVPSEGGKKYPFQKVDGARIYEIPVGPIHAGIIEPGHFRFSVAGEEIMLLEARLGFVHKGAEKLFETLALSDKLRLSEKISGDSSFSHSLAFCQALEILSNIAVPLRALYLRTIYAELERLANHFGDMGAIMIDTGFNFGGAQGARLREMVMQINGRLTGSRFLRGVNKIGGVAKDIGNKKAEDLARSLEKIGKDFLEVIKVANGSSSLFNRLQGTGTLSLQAARNHGVVGVAAKAAGILKDARVDYPYAAYQKLGFNHIETEKDGDENARFKVRVKEALASIKLIQEALRILPQGPIEAKEDASLKKNAIAIGVVEGWRGNIVYFIATDSHGNISRVAPRDPSFLNWPAVGEVGPGNVVPDFPLINKSFNLSYSGNDL